MFRLIADALLVFTVLFGAVPGLAAEKLNGSESSMCYLKDGNLSCMGLGQSKGHSIPTDLKAPFDLASGFDFNCVIDVDGVRCWGADALSPPDLVNPRKLAAGFAHACAWDDTGLKCWGDKWCSPSDYLPKTLKNPEALAIGVCHACAINQGKVECWGLSDGGNTGGYTNVPQLKNPRMIAAGDFHSCAIDDEGVKCWGDVSDVPTTLKNPRALATSTLSRTVCVLDDEGVQCWGGLVVPPLPKLQNPKMLALTDRGLCVVDKNGIHCIGVYDVKGRVPNFNRPELASFGPQVCFAESGKLNCGRKPSDHSGSTPPTLAPSEMTGVRSIVSGDNHSCALNTQGVQCWGDASSAKAQAVPADLIVPREIAAGSDYTCALEDQSVYCWGVSWYDSDHQEHDQLRVLTHLKSPRHLAVAARQSGSVCVIDDDGVQCAQSYGRRVTPSFTLKNPRALSVGDSHTCAADENGIQCAETNKPAFTLPLHVTKAIELVAGPYKSVCALGENGVACWDFEKELPANIPALKNPYYLFKGTEGFCALDDLGYQCWW